MADEKAKNGKIADVAFRWGIPGLLLLAGMWANVRGLEKEVPKTQQKVETHSRSIGKLETGQEVQGVHIRALQAAVSEIEQDIRGQNSVLSRIERAVVRSAGRHRGSRNGGG